MNINDITVGQRVYWCDPDTGVCSAPGTVREVDETDGRDFDSIIRLSLDSGGEVECYAHELTAMNPIAVELGKLTKGGKKQITAKDRLRRRRWALRMAAERRAVAKRRRRG